ncbi:hypothetical protein C475_15218 [Halosimplex carlsbadense 2-9-1]|uniref:cGAS/DncV-like nucleotidyltransferase C-terminal helical domain-containing protein n=2 Tax=Halosimplex carlsbadense TaxID=171164 RepID=M0CLY4_9EURY|nr:hypothetical protein C475_15218 [Halosimplex carlsbadense 2-9-1]
MTIPPSVLDTWTNQGSTSNSSDTYSSVQRAIENGRYGLENEDFDHSYDIHLQGSYANYTNIYGTSDVDIVVRVTMPFQEDLEDLNLGEKNRFWDNYQDLDYDWEDFYSRVERALRGYFGRDALEIGDKAIKVNSESTGAISKDADIVPAADYRKYSEFPEDGDEVYDTGMYFKTQTTGRPIVNYSKIHREKGSDKNDLADQNYKPTIRMIKNAAKHAINRGYLSDDAVSSYYLEGLLYNVPNSIFKQSDLQDRYLDIIEWLQNADLGDLPEQSEMYPLCQWGDPDRWTVSNAEATVEALEKFWDDY